MYFYQYAHPAPEENAILLHPKFKFSLSLSSCITGESWGHACTIRIVLFWSGRERQAMLYKSPNRKETTVPYQVTVRKDMYHSKLYP